jgi:hypothetical protein
MDPSLSRRSERRGEVAASSVTSAHDTDEAGEAHRVAEETVPVVGTSSDPCPVGQALAAHPVAGDEHDRVDPEEAQVGQGAAQTRTGGSPYSLSTGHRKLVISEARAVSRSISIGWLSSTLRRQRGVIQRRYEDQALQGAEAQAGATEGRPGQGAANRTRGHRSGDGVAVSRRGACTYDSLAG